MKLNLYLLCTALALTQSGFSQISQSVLSIPNASLTGGVPRVEVPFKLYRDYLIVVQGSLGEFEGLNFLIDTGVDPTEVDTRIARNFPLVGRVHKLALLDQDTDVRQVTLPSLQLGPIRAKSVPAVIQNLSLLREALGIRIDAIIGLGVLSLSSFSIDYTAKKIAFGPIDSSPSTVPFDTGPPVLTVQLRLKGRPVRVLVDTGAAELVLFGCRLRGRLRPLPVSGVTRFRVNGAAMELRLKEVWLPGVRLGETDLALPKGLEADGNANCGRPFDGVVGVTRLGLKWIAFDFEHRSFSWRR
jgi:hypothetical protein